MFKIRLGIPEMSTFWAHLSEQAIAGKLSADEAKLYKKWGKAMALLSSNPRHTGLNSHEIDALSRRYGVKVFQSYL